MLGPLREGGGGGSKAAKRPAVQVHGRVEEREATKKLSGGLTNFCQRSATITNGEIVVGTMLEMVGPPIYID